MASAAREKNRKQQLFSPSSLHRKWFSNKEMDRFRIGKKKKLNSHWFSQSHNGWKCVYALDKSDSISSYIKITSNIRGMQMWPALWIIALSALFHTSDGEMCTGQTRKCALGEGRRNARDQSGIEDFGSFRHLPQERHYASSYLHTPLIFVKHS